MAADLTRLYESLGQVADAAAVPGVDKIRARVRQRRIRTISVALSAVLVLAVLASTAAWLLPRIESAVPPDVGPPTTFLPFDPSAKPVVRTESGFDFGYAIARPGRAYVMWLDDNSVERVVAIDTAAGKPLWEPTVLGRFGDTNGMMVSRDAILMLTEQRFANDGGPVGSDRLIAVDPATGKVMWELDYGFNDTDRVLYDDVLVLSWQREGRVEALDLKTGSPKWTAREKVIAGGTNPVRTYEEFRVTGAAGLAEPPPTDPRVVLQLEDGRVQVRDAATGRLISERAGAGLQTAPDVYSYPAVFEDKVYAVDQRGLVEIELTGASAPRVVFAPTGNVNAPIVPCGRTLICVLDTKKGSFATDLVLVDTSQSRQVWRKPVGEQADAPLPSAGGVLIVGDGMSMVFDMSGNQLWTAPDSAAGWVDSGNLLVFGQAGVSGHVLSSDKTVPLGGGHRFCAWDATHLTCPGPQGIFTWRYR